MFGNNVNKKNVVNVYQPHIQTNTERLTVSKQSQLKHQTINNDKTITITITITTTTITHPFSTHHITKQTQSPQKQSKN